MKKIITWFLAVCIVRVGFSSCSGEPAQSSEPESSAVQEATPTPEPTATPTHTPEPTDKSIDMVTIDFKGVKFSVPSDWKKSESTDNIVFATSYEDTSILSLNISEFGSEIDVNESTFRNGYIIGLSSVDGYEAISTGDITINGYAGFEHHFIAESSGTLLDTSFYGIGKGNKLVGYMFGIVNSADGSTKEQFQSDIAAILDSVDLSGLSTPTPIPTSTSGPSLEPTPTSEPALAIDWHNSGTYKVGTDLTPGIYYFDTTGNRAGYYAVSTDSSGDLSSIVDNDNVDNFTFLSVEDGQYLEVKHGRIAPAEQIDPIQPVDGKYISGTYRVGVDIPAGEYNVIQENKDRTAYYSVLSNLSGGVGSIEANDNFDGNAYISVSDGQYLKISHAYIAAGE